MWLLCTIQVLEDATASKDRNGMSLIFPNRSRSFDDTKNAVRFSGYDGMFEVKFLVEAAALNSTNETGCLNAFDNSRTAIQKAATKLYASRRGSSFTLSSQDLG
jgi:hypothetical protein